MTEREAQVRRAVSLIEDAFPSGVGAWARKRFDAWVEAMAGLDGAAVEWAAQRLVREWSNDHSRPFPGHLRERAEERSKRNGARGTGEVQFVEAAYDHRDPPGTVRWIVVQPDGRRIPANARAAGES